MRTVNDILSSKGGDVKTIDAKQSVYEAICDMDAHHIGSLVVLEEGKLAGIVSERDYTCKVTVQGKNARDTPVEEIMTRRVVVIKLDTSIDECMALMTKRRLRHLPVMDDDRLLGLISIGDVVKEIIEEQDFVIKQLEGYIYS